MAAWSKEVLRDSWVIETNEAQDNLRKLATETDAAKKKTEGFADFLKRDLTASFFSAQAAYNLFIGAVRGAKDIVIESSKAYLENEEIAARMSVVLRNAGYDAEQLGKHFSEQAFALARATGKSDDYIGNLQTLILGMGVAAKDVDRFTRVSLDLAAVMGQDATTAARLLARANAEGKEELKKYGITIEATSGEGEGFARVLDEVERKTKGINEEMPKAIRHMREYGATWDELKKQLGGGIVKSISESGLAMLVNDMTNLALGTKEFKFHWDQLKAGKPFLELVDKTNELAANFNKIKGGTGVDFTVPEIEIDLVKGDKEKAAARKKADAAEEAEWKRHARARTELYAEEVRLQDETAKNAEKAAEEKEQADVAYQEALAKVNQEELDARDAHETALRQIVIKQRQQTADAALKEEQRLKAATEQTMNSVIAYGKQVGNVLTGHFKEALLSNTTFTRAMFERQVQRETVGMKEEDALKKRQAMEQKLADDNKNTLMKKLADTLANVAIDAQISALMETASAIRSAANYDYSAAASHGVAAAAFGAVAIAAGGAAIGISSTRGLSGDERAQLEAADKSAAEERAQREAAQEAQRGSSETAAQINVYHLGITGQTEQEQGKELERIRQKYDDMKTGS